MSELYRHTDIQRFEWKPSLITICDTRTGAQVEEPSYVALSTKEKGHGPFALLAVGRAALAYQGQEDVAVYSPLRDGQIADYSASVLFLRSLLSQVIKIGLFKPVMCIRTQKEITQVEERALVDAGMQLGAKRVYLYQESLPAMLEAITQNRFKGLKNAVVIHIEPQN